MPPYHRDIDPHTLASLLRSDEPAIRRPAEHSRDPPEPAPQHTVAYFSANPHGTQPLKLAEECAAIQREIALAPHRSDFCFHARGAISGRELCRHLNELDPRVIHFGAHAGTSGLLLQGEHGEPEPVSPQVLAMLVQAAARSVRVIVLNGCDTIEHAKALRRAAEVIVAMAGPITDDGARMFSSVLYGALGNRRSIGNAVAQGVAMLALKQPLDAPLPRCVHRRGVDPYQVFLPACSPQPESR